MLDEAVMAYGWIGVTHGQAVLIVTADGEAARVELLDGPYAGRRGWMETCQLSPRYRPGGHDNSTHPVLRPSESA